MRPMWMILEKVRLSIFIFYMKEHHKVRVFFSEIYFYLLSRSLFEIFIFTAEKR